MKTIRWDRLRIAVCFLLVSSLISGTLGALTDTPTNKVALQEDLVTLKCSSDIPNSVIWQHDSVVISSGGSCATSFPGFTMSNGSSDNDCYLQAQGTSSLRLSGPYSCSDGSTPTAQAVLIVIEPQATCGVLTSGPVIRGDNVTLTCKVTYYCKSPEARLNPGAGIIATINWEAAAGTFLSNTSSPELLNGRTFVGETLEVSVSTLASGAEIPSYNCTTAFQFTDRTDASVDYATNNLAWTCVSAPVPTWYCPVSVNITPPAESALKAGGNLTCMSDGYPQPSYVWTDTYSGVVHSTASTITLTAGWFNLTCTAIGNMTLPCNASISVTGFAVSCPTNLGVNPYVASFEYAVNQTLTCHSTGGAPEPSYYWLNGSIVAAVGAMITLTEPGYFNLTCLANSSYNGIDCSETYLVQGVVSLVTSTVPTTTPPTTTTAAVTTTAATTTNNSVANVTGGEDGSTTAMDGSNKTDPTTTPSTTTAPGFVAPLTLTFALLALLAIVAVILIARNWSTLSLSYLLKAPAPPITGEPVQLARPSRYQPVFNKRPLSAERNVYAPGSISSA